MSGAKAMREKAQQQPEALKAGRLRKNAEKAGGFAGLEGRTTVRSAMRG
jgi:hypothetical protein